MPAIRSHSTETSERPWDGPAQVRKAKSGESESYYANIFAWREPDADEGAKSSYKFVHHFVSPNGTPGAASTRGCSAGVAVLNGGRGGTTIPMADRRGVYNHLARHLRDAGKEVPDLKEEGSIMDRETKALDFEIKSLNEDGTFEGLASTFGPPADAYGDIVEEKAFDKTISDHGGEIVILWQHDTREPVGLGQIEKRADGLWMKGQLELGLETAKKAYVSLKARLVKSLSIGFQTIRKRTEKSVRYLEEIKLYEVSLVTFPANQRALVTDVKSAMTDRLDEMEISAKVWGVWQAFDEIVLNTMFDREMTSDDKIDFISDAFDEFKGLFLPALPDYFRLRRLSSDSKAAESLTKRIEFLQSLRKAADTGDEPAVTPGKSEPEPEADAHHSDLTGFRNVLTESLRGLAVEAFKETDK